MTALIFCLATAIAFVVCFLLVATQHWHVHISGKREDGACHELHQGEVPRLGGSALFVAGLICLTLQSNFIDDASAKLLWSLWACLSMVAAVGMYEDFRRNLPPLARYFGTAFAALFFSVANGGVGIFEIGIAPFDWLLSHSVFGVLFFVFAVTGMTHAFNLIDGQNGLSGGVAALSHASLAYVAIQTNQAPLGLLALTMAGANIGFLLLNYPFGKIFLGDCGAYFNGASLGAVAALVVAGSPDVSPWYALTLLIYPTWETVFSMIRRRRRNESLFHPDVEHLHHLFFARDRRQPGVLRHSSAPRLLILAALPAALATFCFGHTAVLVSGSMAFVALYLVLYTHLLEWPENAHTPEPS